MGTADPPFLPYLLPYLGESGWFSVSLGARKPLNTNDFGIWPLRGGGSENREVNGTQPTAADIQELLQRNDSRKIPIQTHSLGKERCPFVLGAEFPARERP